MPDPETARRLQIVLARAGYGSRRACEELIRQGRVNVDGQAASLGCRVAPGSLVTVDGKVASGPELKVYIALHKPRGFLSVMSDDRGRPALGDMVTVPQRLYPVGRLDLNSEGLILLTNDGGLAHALTHPRFGHSKKYLVLVEGRPDDTALAQLRRGVMVDGRRTRPAEVRRLQRPPQGFEEPPAPSAGPAAWLEIALREGRKRQIRHMCALVGHPVLRLVRVCLGPLTLGALKPGEWRVLKPDEVLDLQRTTQRQRGGDP
jgi:23S rRNA pseudouridine2605 synthase